MLGVGSLLISNWSPLAPLHDDGKMHIEMVLFQAIIIIINRFVFMS